MKTKLSRCSRGFTLIEILIVIAVLAMLAAAAWEATAWIKNKQMVKTAENQIALLEQAVNAYKTDNGGYLPAGKGDEWSSHVLYQALYCDYDNNGEPDQDKKTDAVMMPYCTSFVIIKNTKAKEREEGIPVIKAKMKASAIPQNKRTKGNKFYVILDPWNNPYRYRLGFDAEANGKAGNGMNADFDIFSQGPDMRGDSRNIVGDNADNISNIRYN